MTGDHHVARLLKSEVKYILLALAAVVYAPGSMAYGSDVKEYEGNTMTFVITKPTTNAGYNYPQKVRYSYSVNDGSAKIGSDYSVPDGKSEHGAEARLAGPHCAAQRLGYWHQRDHARDRQVQDLRLALAGALC